MTSQESSTITSSSSPHPHSHSHSQVDLLPRQSIQLRILHGITSYFFQIQDIESHPSFGSSKSVGNAVLLSFLLGSIFTAGFFLAFTDITQLQLPSTESSFGLYLLALSLYHFAEWLCVAAYSPTNLSADSFLLNQSTPFTIAMTASVLEYFFERWQFPGLKSSNLVFLLGLCMTIVGQIIRVAAEMTAKNAFTHIIVEQKSQAHKLVTHGVYRFMRHPGYFGWFLWSVGTQVMIANPVCIVGFAAAAWSFFKLRIAYEERTLELMFGEEWKEYKRVTPTLIPGIN